MPLVSTRCKRAGGFTFLELIVALAVAGITLAGALPALQSLGHKAALTSDVNRLQQAFSLARNTAITRRATVTLCPVDAALRCTSDWRRPLAVVTGAPEGEIDRHHVIRLFPAREGSHITYNRGWPQVRYTRLGHASGYNGRFELCSGALGRRLVLSQLGRLRLDPATPACSDQAMPSR